MTEREPPALPEGWEWIAPGYCTLRLRDRFCEVAYGEVRCAHVHESGRAPLAVVLACIADAHPAAREHLEAAMAAIGGSDE